MKTTPRIFLCILAALFGCLRVDAQTDRPVYLYPIEEVLDEPGLVQRALAFKPSTHSQIVWQLKLFIEKGRRNNSRLKVVIKKLEDLIALEEEAIRINGKMIADYKDNVKKLEEELTQLTGEADDINRLIRELNSKL
jgi:hypothetical protein